MMISNKQVCQKNQKWTCHNPQPTALNLKFKKKTKITTPKAQNHQHEHLANYNANAYTGIHKPDPTKG